MRIQSVFAAAALLLAAPAAAVTVTGISAGGGNSATVVTQEPGLLAVDFAVRASSPIRLDLEAGSDFSFGFNSLVDIFTALENGQNIRSLSISLTGATILQIGDIAPSFAGYTTSQNPAFTLFTINFTGPGEPNAVLLGSLARSQDFVFARDPAAGPVSLTLQAAVPEPATWAMLLLGFSAIGMAARTRSTRAARIG